ncbi:MAG TPA: hypothetical protein VG737_13925 [Cyclobacteriaceae bacterium]|nr:hypothetical protein [Cyclobacteriaceae bacterium]
MNLRLLIIQNVLIILFCFIVLYLDQMEFKSTHNALLVIFFSLVKSGFFVVMGFRKILYFSKSDLRYHHFLLFIGLSIGLMMVSFATDYFCLYQIDERSFAGIDPDVTLGEEIFKFFFFSVLIFSNLGVASVVPSSIPAEFVMMTEGVLSFITIILVLSDFISLKESLQGIQKKLKTPAKQD